ncbi:ATP-dependent DNA helicase PIF1 [Ceratobasidium sp. AG-Ba]|nr:ATP-dependent DNA helicase PIF1 [Ceratobasidium sp. AG-Ba]
MPPQLLLLMIGEGGTGKSRVIQTIIQEFRRLGKEEWLIKGAFTGSAASHIEGQTIHNIARIMVGKLNDPISHASKQQLVKKWQPVRYLIIDEFSMLSKEFLAVLSRHISIAKLGYSSDNGDFPFGGVNVLLCGDGHQILPVATSKGGALHHPTTSSRFLTTTDAGLGRKIFEWFDLAVTLKRQVQVVDPVWQGFLSRFRVGQVEAGDIELLDSITLTNPNCRPTDFNSEKWRNCVLITPRNSVQRRWNDAAVEEHCWRTGEQMLVFDALDTCVDQGKQRPVTTEEKYASMLNSASKGNPRKGKREQNGLPDQIRIAIGMKVMVTTNINTDIDITNGARGEIVGIKLDAHEPPFSPTEPRITLKCAPVYILVWLNRTRVGRLLGLEPGVVPIAPVSRSYSMKVPVLQADGQVKLISRNIKRWQFPIAPAYAFTDYKAQGQTLECAIVDIAEPPTGGRLSQPNIYVALSRCPDLDSIRILRDFDRDILRRPVDVDLMKEDERLERLNEKTLKWWNELNAEDI